MVPDKAREILTEAQLEIVLWTEQTSGVRGLNYDVMSGGVEVVDGEGRRVVIAPDGLQVEPAAWQTVDQAMQMARRWRAFYAEQNGTAAREPGGTG